MGCTPVGSLTRSFLRRPECATDCAANKRVARDSLLSIVQMPKGIPVATVAIGNAANAALLAVRMLGISEPKLLDAMAAYMEAQEATVLEKAARLEEKGYRGYE